MSSSVHPAAPLVLIAAVACNGGSTTSEFGMPAPRAASAGTAVIAHVDGGAVRGVMIDGVIAFRGIPYAAPPTGALRWKPPQPVEPWSGTREALEFGHDCVQRPMPGDAAAGGSSRDEDCLVLNVWRSSDLNSMKQPVLVWIHGGGFLNGAGSVPFFDGSSFARKGVVVVTVNYRLGRMGFFAHPALTAEHGGPSANFAFLDQLAALQWVQRNIDGFGGDPRRVTLAGQSAGGISVIQLLTWPAARGLFHRAVVLSGGGRTFVVPSREQADAERSGVAFARAIGIRDVGAAGLERLRAVPASRVNGTMSMAALLTRPLTYAGGPVRDGDVVRSEPEARFREGDFAHVPLIIGTVGGEAPGDLGLELLRPFSLFGSEEPRAREVYGTRNPVDAALTVSADFAMHEPARFVASTMRAAGLPAWVYRFDYVPTSMRGERSSAAHASELSFLFDQLDVRFGRAVSERDREIARLFHGYVVNFAKTGDPNGAGLPWWAAFDPSSYDLLMVDDGGARMREDPLRERLTLVARARR